jgi:hypothetical protein
MLLEYLVPSKVRRNLVDVLWRKHATGSVSELARLAGVAASAADKEIAAMEALGLVTVRRLANARVVEANDDSPFSPALRALLDAEHARPSASTEEPSSDRVRAWLSHYGAPLVADVSDRASRTRPAVEESLVHGLRLSHSDASVARATPVLLWRNRDRLHVADLIHRARQAGQGRTLGFFADLTAEMTGDEQLSHLASELRDRRVRRDTFFFKGAEDTLTGKELAELNTPAVARRWHYLMNMPMDSFETMFRKAARAPSTK